MTFNNLNSTYFLIEGYEKTDTKFILLIYKALLNIQQVCILAELLHRQLTFQYLQRKATAQRDRLAS
jgi:hypothetical protein